MKLYGIKSCDTCRKALKLLETAEFVDVRTDGFPDDVMARAIAHFGEVLLNKRSTTWRGLDEDTRARPVEELLKAHPTVMKRPLIDKDGMLFLGWDKAVQAELVG